MALWAPVPLLARHRDPKRCEQNNCGEAEHGDHPGAEVNRETEPSLRLSKEVFEGSLRSI
jgi:hypothetical protein